MIYGDHGFKLGEHGGKPGEINLYREGTWVHESFEHAITPPRGTA